MPDGIYEERAVATTTVVTHPNWGAIWAGVFTFIAIWSIFGVLGMAIFSTAANPTAARPVTGMSTGMGVWAIILTIIAMYGAGIVTGKLASIGNRRDGVIHGIIMFGLSVASVLLILSLGEGAVAANTTSTIAVNAHSSYVLAAFASVGWIGFVAMILGWLAAMGGASSGVKSRTPRAANPPMRHAA